MKTFRNGFRVFLVGAVLLLVSGCPFIPVGGLLPSTIEFADGDEVTKVLGSGNYTNTVSGDGAGAVSYSSSDPETATVDAVTGEVTLVGVGITTITATKAATASHSGVSESYELTVTAVVYSVGDAGPAGGIVFYDKGSVSDGWRYLEVSPVGTEASAMIYGYYLPDGITHTAVGTQTAIGTGSANTDALVNSMGNTPYTKDSYGDYIPALNSYAAQYCANLSSGGFSDWFLPSSTELLQLYSSLAANVTAGFSAGGYWSSSEDASFISQAWSISFINGAQFSGSRAGNNRVRAIRAF